MKEYCPLCKKEVEYEYAYGDFICPICGRSKSSAKEDAQILERADRKKRIRKWTLLIIGFLSLMLILWLYQNVKIFRVAFIEGGLRAFQRYWLAYLILAAIYGLVEYRSIKKNQK